MPAPLKRRFRWSSLALILLLGILLRLNLSVKAFSSTFDTSTVGLMAMHILEGDRPLFYYGQTYMGALEAYATAIMFFLFGISTTTLSFAPILFAAGWIVAMYLLFAELFSARAGLAAALCTAVGGWYAMWFSMASYGGYGATFLFGTVFLTLAVRTAGRDLRRGACWVHAAAMGVVAALGIWTNFQVFSYLVTGGLILLAGMMPAGKRRIPAVPMLAAGLVALTGFVPLLASGDRIRFGSADWGSPSVAAVPEHARALLERLPQIFLWPVDSPGLLVKASLVSWLAAAVLYAVKVASERRRKERSKALVPLLFVVVFLPFYLVHPLAATAPVGYLIAPATMITAAFFGGAVSHRWRAVRWAGYSLLAAWALFNSTSALQTAEVKARAKKDVVIERTRIIEQAEEEGLRHLMILGSHRDGYTGQSLTFYARDRVRYVSSTHERYFPAMVSAELDPRTGFIFREEHLPKVERSLASAGISSFGRKIFRWTTLYDLKVPHERRRSIPPGAMRLDAAGAAEGAAGSLVDRRAGTGVEGPAGGEGRVTITAALDRPRSISGIWLTGRDSERLPGSFEISTSMDGIEYAPVGPKFRDILPAYIAGNRVYMMGYYARNDLRFGPVRARFVRITLGNAGKRKQGWSVNELFLFEHEGPADEVSPGEVEETARILGAEAVDFTVADRWLSAQLDARIGSGGPGPAVFPPFNPRHPHTMVPRLVVPRPGLAVAVERAVAEECGQVLERHLSPQVSLGRADLPHYTLFTFGGPDSAFKASRPSLEWNGHAVLEADVSGRR